MRSSAHFILSAAPCSRFTSAGVGGGYTNPDGEDKGPYVRMMKDLDVSKDDDKQRVLEILGGGVLNELSVRVIVEGEEIEEDSAVEKFIEQLKERAHLHFYAAGA